jgi:hypothetical protein
LDATGICFTVHIMRARILLAGGAVLVSALAGCGVHQVERPAKTATAPKSTAVVLPKAAAPSRTSPCPYLDKRDVAEINGQLVRKVRISGDKPYPGCFFYAFEGDRGVQLSTRIYVGGVAVARGLVDQAAPVKTSSIAEDPTGWSGGSQPTSGGAVYAVSKGGKAVVVTTNQRQTIKAREVTETIIKTLHL